MRNLIFDKLVVLFEIILTDIKYKLITMKGGKFKSFDLGRGRREKSPVILLLVNLALQLTLRQRLINTI